MANHNPPANKNYPDRAYVERIATEEAVAACACLGEVLGMARGGQAVSARHRAFRRITRETGCSVEGLAAVWGCHAESVKHALRTEDTLALAMARDADLEARNERLRWAHGDKRAALIIAGTDAQTNRDIAAWRALGSHRGRAA